MRSIVVGRVKSSMVGQVGPSVESVVIDGGGDSRQIGHTIRVSIVPCVVLIIEDGSAKIGPCPARTRDMEIGRLVATPLVEYRIAAKVARMYHLYPWPWAIPRVAQEVAVDRLTGRDHLKAIEINTVLTRMVHGLETRVMR